MKDHYSEAFQIERHLTLYFCLLFSRIMENYQLLMSFNCVYLFIFFFLLIRCTLKFWEKNNRNHLFSSHHVKYINYQHHLTLLMQTVTADTVCHMSPLWSIQYLYAILLKESNSAHHH